MNAQEYPSAHELTCHTGQALGVRLVQMPRVIDVVVVPWREVKDVMEVLFLGMQCVNHASLVEYHAQHIEVGFIPVDVAVRDAGHSPLAHYMRRAEVVG